MKDYIFPCYPGDDVWFIESYHGNPVYYSNDKVEMVGFTTRSIHIKLRRHHNFNKTYIWNKNVFADKETCLSVYNKLKGETT